MSDYIIFDLDGVLADSSARASRIFANGPDPDWDAYHDCFDTYTMYHCNGIPAGYVPPLPDIAEAQAKLAEYYGDHK